MAERLKVKLLESDKLVDIVAGPDAYRDIPRLIEAIEVGTFTHVAWLLRCAISSILSHLFRLVVCLLRQLRHKK